MAFLSDRDSRIRTSAEAWICNARGCDRDNNLLVITRCSCAILAWNIARSSIETSAADRAWVEGLLTANRPRDRGVAGTRYRRGVLQRVVR
jgi:hypothetical protein